MNDDDKSFFDRLKARGEEVFSQITNDLMQNERFMKAMQGAFAGKQKLDQAVGRALKTMNVPTRSELKRAVARIDALEQQVEALQEKLESFAKKVPASRSGRAAAKTSRGKRSA
jgi:polyhydroxyalkanoate synthesis regulator phasin